MGFGLGLGLGCDRFLRAARPSPALRLIPPYVHAWYSRHYACLVLAGRVGRGAGMPPAPARAHRCVICGAVAVLWRCCGGAVLVLWLCVVTCGGRGPPLLGGFDLFPPDDPDAEPPVVGIDSGYEIAKWTGKTPTNLLYDYCRAQKWHKPGFKVTAQPSRDRGQRPWAGTGGGGGGMGTSAGLCCGCSVLWPLCGTVTGGCDRVLCPCAVPVRVELGARTVISVAVCCGRAKRLCCGCALM